MVRASQGGTAGFQTRHSVGDPASDWSDHWSLIPRGNERLVAVVSPKKQVTFGSFHCTTTGTRGPSQWEDEMFLASNLLAHRKIGTSARIDS